MMRYSRQIPIPNLGPEGQEKLSASRVAVIGSGGLGSPVLYYLAAAGIGEITFADGDSVEESNLNRQFIHWEHDIGRLKADSAAEKLQAFHSGIKINAIPSRITEENAVSVLTGYQVIVDCVDNVKSRYVIQRAGLQLEIPVVEAGVREYYGFQMNSRRGSACLGCLWGSPEESRGGTPVIGAVAGVIGSLQAVQAIKIILGSDDELYGKAYMYDLLSMSFDTIEVKRDPLCPICGDLY